MIEHWDPNSSAMSPTPPEQVIALPQNRKLVNLGCSTYQLPSLQALSQTSLSLYLSQIASLTPTTSQHPQTPAEPGKATHMVTTSTYSLLPFYPTQLLPCVLSHEAPSSLLLPSSSGASDAGTPARGHVRTAATKSDGSLFRFFSSGRRITAGWQQRLQPQGNNELFCHARRKGLKRLSRPA